MCSKLHLQADTDMLKDVDAEMKIAKVTSLEGSVFTTLTSIKKLDSLQGKLEEHEAELRKTKIVKVAENNTS